MKASSSELPAGCQWGSGWQLPSPNDRALRSVRPHRRRRDVYCCHAFTPAGRAELEQGHAITDADIERFGLMGAAAR